MNESLTITEVQQAPEVPNWPIRVGGEYAKHPQDDFGMTRVVAAIDGGTVYYRNTFPSGRQGPINNTSASTFRSVSSPEDTSSLDPLYSLLGRCRKAVVGDVTLSEKMGVLEAIDAALATQEVR